MDHLLLCRYKDWKGCGNIGSTITGASLPLILAVLKLEINGW